MTSHDTPSIQISVITLGCKTNQCDAEEIARALTRAGYAATASNESFDALNSEPSTLNSVFIVNTCTVTGTADAKARKLVRKLQKEHPKSTIIVTGCYAERAAEDLRKLGAIVVPRSDQNQLVEIVGRSLRLRREMPLLETAEPETPPYSTRRTRAFLKVQDGCNHACTYCIVYTVRGAMRSMPIPEVMAEVTRLAEAGYQEIVLCGIHLGAYGIDLPGHESLARLLHALRDIPIRRLRLSSVEPMDISDSLIDEMSDHPSLCHHLHLPLQSGDDGVLRDMGRGYRIADYEDIVNRVRKHWPDLSLTTDIMVGFPGESDAAFAHTVAVTERLGFPRIHVFRYSPRPGTPAATRRDQVAEEVKRQRSIKLQRVAQALFRNYAGQWMGKRVDVLFEQQNSKTGRWEGVTSHYLRVEVPSQVPLADMLLPVTIEAVGKDCLIGTLQEENTD